MTTGLQTAHLGLVSLLERWREQMSPRDWVVLVDLITRWLKLERERTEQARRRWVA